MIHVRPSQGVWELGEGKGEEEREGRGERGGEVGEERGVPLAES